MSWFSEWWKRWFPPAPVPTPVPPPPGPLLDWNIELLRLHNVERRNRSLSLLTWDYKLQKACQGWADHMAATGRMVHSNVGGIITDAGYSWSRCGENIAWNYQDPAAVVRAWMTSPGHKANILGNYRDVAICFAKVGTGGFYWCAVFAMHSSALGLYGQEEPQLSGTLEFK